MNEYKQYRKKPVVVHARLLDDGDAPMKIPTLEGVMTASPGDYVICGVKGELYPCKPDIFVQTYEEV